MSDLLIRGMEMPKPGQIVLVDIDENGDVFAAYDGGRTKLSQYKAVPVPPHGRLIDADKMRESIRKQTAFLRLIGGEFAEIAETLEKGFLQEIDNAPTIIPAEPFNNLSKPYKEDAP